MDAKLINTIRNKVDKIQLVILDVDGVLTDGSLILGEQGKEYKNFHVHDGLGIKLLQEAGIKVGFLTSRKSKPVVTRAKELGIDLLYQGAADKLELIYEIVNETNIKMDAICYMGDDLPDLPVLKNVGFSVTVPDAPDEIKKNTDCVTERSGGRGAVRELAELILKTQGKWENQIKQFE